ncbi:hypothetical protein C8R46DRAFT_1034121 [Mycena filopes]|nr:hypothetical protein C8R46DRAFT_1034121 [Mycena filopes]
MSAQGLTCPCAECGAGKKTMMILSLDWHLYATISQPTWTEGNWKTLFHGTVERNARRILKYGLLLPWQRGKTSPGQFSHQGAVYMTDKSEEAAKFARFKTGEPRVAVLEFRWCRSGMRVLEFGEGEGPERGDFLDWLILSLTSWGRDVTSILPPRVFRDRGLTAGDGSEQPIHLEELQQVIARTVARYDMIAGPMLMTEPDAKIHACQYAITSTEGLANLTPLGVKLYDRHGVISRGRSRAHL